MRVLNTIDCAVSKCAKNKAVALAVIGAATLFIIHTIFGKDVEIAITVIVSIMATAVAYCLAKIYSILRPRRFEMKRLLKDSHTHISHKSTSALIRIKRDDSAICAELGVDADGVVERIKFLDPQRGFVEHYLHGRPQRLLETVNIDGFSLRFDPSMALGTASVVLNASKRSHRKVSERVLLHYLSGVNC